MVNWLHEFCSFRTLWIFPMGAEEDGREYGDIIFPQQRKEVMFAWTRLEAGE